MVAQRSCGVHGSGVALLALLLKVRFIKNQTISSNFSMSNESGTRSQVTGTTKEFPGLCWEAQKEGNVNIHP